MSIDTSGGLKLHASTVTIGSDGKVKGPTEYWGLSAGSGKLIIDDGSNGSKLLYSSNYVSVDSSNVNLIGSSILTNTGSFTYTGALIGTSTAYSFRMSGATTVGDKLFSLGDTSEKIYINQNTLTDFYEIRSTTDYIGLRSAGGDGIAAQGFGLVYIYGAGAPQMLFTANTSITNAGAFPISFGTSGTPWASIYGTDGYFNTMSIASKVGFYGTTAITQPTAAVNTHTVAAGSATNVFTNTTFDGGTGSTAYTVGDIVAALKALGLITS